MRRIALFLFAALAVTSAADGGMFIDIDPVSGLARSTLTMINEDWYISGATATVIVDAELDMVESDASSTTLDIHLGAEYLTGWFAESGPLSMILTFNCAQTAAGQTASAGQQMIDYELSLFDRYGNPSDSGDDFYIQSGWVLLPPEPPYGVSGPLESIDVTLDAVSWPSENTNVSEWQTQLAISLDTNFPSGPTGTPWVHPYVYFRFTATSASAVPEPSTLLLALFSLALLPRRRQR